MHEVSFESTTTMTPAAFRSFVEEHARWDLNHFELLNGRIVMNPPAGYPHGELDSKLQVLLGGYIGAHKLGKSFGSSQGFDLPSGDTVGPDASFVSNERWASAPPPEAGEFLKVVPDLSVEIFSASTGSRDRGEKKAIYERNGVREYWILDWRSRELTVFHLVDGKFDAGSVFTQADTAKSSVLTGLEFPVSDLLP
jgi:Uma2 family endonuclease